MTEEWVRVDSKSTKGTNHPAAVKHIDSNGKIDAHYVQNKYLSDVAKKHRNKEIANTAIHGAMAIGNVANGAAALKKYKALKAKKNKTPEDIQTMKRLRRVLVASGMFATVGTVGAIKGSKKIKNHEIIRKGFKHKTCDYSEMDKNTYDAAVKYTKGFKEDYLTEAFLEGYYDALAELY